MTWAKRCKKGCILNSIESRSRVNTCIDGTQGFGDVFNLALPLIEIEPRKFNESKSAHNTEAEYIRKKRRTSNDEQSYSAKIQFQLRPRHMHCIASIDHDTFSRSRCVCVHVVIGFPVKLKPNSFSLLWLCPWSMYFNSQRSLHFKFTTQFQTHMLSHNLRNVHLPTGLDSKIRERTHRGNNRINLWKID